MSRATSKKSLLQVESLERRENPSASISNGTLIVVGTSGNDAITLDTYGAAVRVIDNAVVRSFPAAAVHGIAVFTGNCNDTVSIQRLFPGMRTDVYLGTGDDSLDLAQGLQDLDYLLSDVHVLGQTGIDTVNIHDRNDNGGAQYLLSLAHLTDTGRPFAGLEFLDMDNVNLNTRDTAGVVRIDGIAAGTSVVVSGGSGPETVIAGTGDLDSLMGPVRVVGNGSNDTVYVYDYAHTGSDAYSLGTSTISRPRFGGLTYQGVESVRLTGQPGDNIFRITGIPVVGVSVSIDGDLGTDSMVGPSMASTWALSGSGVGAVWNYSFTNVEQLYGGWINDTFRFTSASGQDWARIDGGLGVDRLDYSLYPSGVAANLAAGTATKVVNGGYSSIENVIGSEFTDSIRGDSDHNNLSGLGGNDVMFGGDGYDVMDGGGGHDIMFGQDGNDSMTGGLGRDIMFSGAGADVMDGGADDDILGSGTTTYESNVAGLQMVLAEWTSSHNYWDRVWNIRGESANSSTYGSRLNGSNFLETEGSNPNVIHPATAEDAMTGGAMTPADGNHDWFFGHASEYLDREAGEAVNA